jgi:tryptophan-rich sensory protein
MPLSWLAAIGIAALAAILEAWLSGRRPFAFLASLNQPPWAMPVTGWLAVGAAFYLIMVLAMVRMIEAGAAGLVPLGLIVIVLLADGFWNYMLFRQRRLDLAYICLFPYALLVVLATVAVGLQDIAAGFAMAIYVVFLPYDFAWANSLRLRNRQYRSAAASSS